MKAQSGRLRAALALAVATLATVASLAPVVLSTLRAARVPAGRDSERLFSASARPLNSAGRSPATPTSSPGIVVDPTGRRAGHFATSADSIVVYPVHKLTHQGAAGTWTGFDDSFNADTVSGQRYVIEVVNGSTPASGFTVSINGQQFIGTGEFGTGISRLLRVLDVTVGSNAMTIAVKGTGSAWVSVRVVRVTDFTFDVLPYTTHLGPSPSPGGYVDNFAETSGSVAATVRVINGDAAGAHRVTGATLKLNGVQVLGTSDFSTGVAVMERNVVLTNPIGANALVLTGEASGTQMKVRVRATSTAEPVITWIWPPDQLATSAAKVFVSATVLDQLRGSVSVNGRPSFTTTGPTYVFADSLPLPAGDGMTTVTVRDTNIAGLITSISRTVFHDTHAPTITISSPADSIVTGDATVLFSGSWSDALTKTSVSVDGDAVAAAALTGSFSSWSVPLDLGPNAILVRATDAAGNVTQFKRNVFRGVTETGPPPPSLPALTTTGVTPFLSRVQGIYTGASPVQTGVTATIDAGTAAVIHGTVVGRDWGPLPNTTVQILNHNEYGQTLTHTDGTFDLVVNGGAPLILRFTKTGYLEGQRQVTPPWNDFAIVDDVAMIGQSARVNAVDLAADTTVGGRFASDANGDRSIRMYFKQGTEVRVVEAVGDTSTPLASPIHVRAAEYTVGGNGPKTMPGLLPASSAYTYCVSLGIDEADQLVGAGQPSPEILFSKPVICYVKNFLNFPVGAWIPSGAYGRGSGTWTADSDGVVLKVIATGNPANPISVDTDGDGLADGATRLASFGIDSLELVQIGRQFLPGDVVWRMPTRHFSTLDYNPNVAVSTAAASLGSGRAQQITGLAPDPCTSTGSIIECENRVLGESVPIVGTPYSLNYRSYRTRGDQAIRTIRIPVVGTSLPDSLKSIIVRMEVAGQRSEQVINDPSLSTPPVTFTWNGLDLFGRWVEGSSNATITIGYRFKTKYATGSGGRSLDDPNNSALTADLAMLDRNLPNTRWTRRVVSLGAPSTGSDGLGGWMISPHHFYDMTGQGALYRGDGSVVLGALRHPIIKTGFIFNLNGVDIASGPDGNFFVADGHGAGGNNGYQVLKYPKTGGGTATLVAGDPSNSYNITRHLCADGSPATTCPLDSPQRLAVAADGSIYFIMQPPPAVGNGGPSGHVCKIGPDGKLYSIAGSDTVVPGGSGDGGPATSAKFSGLLSSIALGPDGSVFVGDNNAYKVRRIAPNGIISTYAGTGGNTTGGDSTGKATTIGINMMQDLAVDQNGTLYIAAANNRVRQVTPDGIISTLVSQTSDPSFTPQGLEVGPDGALYICTGTVPGLSSSVIGSVWRRDPDGSLNRIAGGGTIVTDGVFATAAKLGGVGGLCVLGDGSLYFATGNICRVGTSLPSQVDIEFVVPSDDGSEVYFFDQNGRHLRTRDAMTGGVRYSFDYDANGQLIGIHDADGRVTGITRTSSTSYLIDPPFHQQTTLTLESGLLKSISNPATETVTLWQHSDGLGLLDSLQDARGGVHRYIYATDGRLALAIDPALGSQTLTVNYGKNARTVTRMTGERAVTSYDVVDLYDGTQRRNVTTVPGHALRTVYSDSTSGVRTTLFPDGSKISETLGPSPRNFGMLAPVVQKSVEVLPSPSTTRTVDITSTVSSGFNPPDTDGSWTEDLKINGAATAFHTQFTLSNSADTRTVTTQSPVGRTTTSSVDPDGRPLTVTVSGIAPVSYSYAQGQLTDVIQDTRHWRYDYDGLGRLFHVTDPLSHVTTFGYDNAGRVTTQTLPDTQVVGFGYDGNGNLTSLTPPGRSAHGFTYTGVDQTLQYTPPSLGSGSWATGYVYTYDRQLKQVTRPDGALVSLVYEMSPDTTGRLSSVTIPRGTLNYAYVPAGQTSGSGMLQSVSSPDGVTLNYGYNGPLPSEC